MFWLITMFKSAQHRLPLCPDYFILQATWNVTPSVTPLKKIVWHFRTHKSSVTPSGQTLITHKKIQYNIGRKRFSAGRSLSHKPHISPCVIDLRQGKQNHASHALDRFFFYPKHFFIKTTPHTKRWRYYPISFLNNSVVIAKPKLSQISIVILQSKTARLSITIILIRNHENYTKIRTFYFIARVGKGKPGIIWPSVLW